MLYFLTLGDRPGADLGPVISPQAKERVCELVQSGVDEGAKVGVIMSCMYVVINDCLIFDLIYVYLFYRSTWMVEILKLKAMKMAILSDLLCFRMSRYTVHTQC